MAGIFGFIIHPMELGLIWLTLQVGGAGIAIILFTIAVRLVLSPLQIVQVRSAKAMQRIQPMVSELKKKHGKDREALQKATMALYKEHKVNPAMGCLPTVLQFPVLIGLFYGLMHLGTSPTGWPGAIVWKNITCNGQQVSNMSQWLHGCYAVAGGAGDPTQIFTLFHAQFLWLSHGLGQHDPLYILPILAGIAQWVQSRMLLSKSTDPQQQMMNTMTNFMPLLIVFFASRYASGLALYWVTSTVIGILIQVRVTGWGLLSEKGGLAIPNPGRLLMSIVSPPSKPSRAPVSRQPIPESNGHTEQNGNAAEDPDELEPVARPVGRPPARPKTKRKSRGSKGGRRS
ncbi:MAG: YidC/Oxa1 family membrane protein insertase [Chloroflexota bacterium]